MIRIIIKIIITILKSTKLKLIVSYNYNSNDDDNIILLYYIIYSNNYN